MPSGVYIRTEETRRKTSEGRLGKKHTKETKIKMSESHKGITREPFSENHKRKISKSMIGKHHTEETKCKISSALEGNKNSYVHGQGYAPYLSEFIRVREQVRARDNWKCQKCGVLQEELLTTLNVHHIDYDKTNNSLDNLITLCISCNVKVNTQRSIWTKFFNQKLKLVKNKGEHYGKAISEGWV